MSQKIILKRLTANDLRFFNIQPSSRDKSQDDGISFQKDVLVSTLYPSLPEILEIKQNLIMVTVNIFGPGLAHEYTIQRRFQNKNLREYFLNGELIIGPFDDPTRFQVLQPGDILIAEFFGELEPNSVRVFIISQMLEDDLRLHTLLDSHLKSRNTIALMPNEIEDLVADAYLPKHHPANLLILGAGLEDAALGGIEGVKALRNSPFSGMISRRSFEQTKRNVHRIERIGMEWVFNYLEVNKEINQIPEFKWESHQNAISPYNFSITEIDGTVTLLNVKSTSGNFKNPIHISFNELLQMKEVPRYDIYRIYNIADDSAKLRISKDVKAFAIEIIDALENLPAGVKTDSVSINPSVLSFGEEEEIKPQLEN